MTRDEIRYLLTDLKRFKKECGLGIDVGKKWILDDTELAALRNVVNMIDDIVNL